MANETEKNLLKTTAHDLNNIFARILSSVELMKSKIAAKEDVGFLIENIENNTNRAADILEDLLNYNHPRNRKINLISLINELVTSFKMHLKKDINITAEFGENINIVYGKYSDLYRVIMNLIVNASEAIKIRGEIKISIYNHPNENRVIISVKDNGSGIPAEFQPRIFTKDFSTKSYSTNRGLGLSIVKEVIEKQGGNISVKSEINKGTEFEISLPSFPSMQKQEAAGQKRKRILITDDETELNELLGELLESYNFEIIKSMNGYQTLELLKKKPLPDLLIIDRKMPEMDGIECIKKIRNMNYTMPIILASGSMSETSKLNAKSIGINKLIYKPYNFDEMLTIINQLL